METPGGRDGDFPCCLVYLTEPGLVVVAVAHDRQRPGYWRGRGPERPPKRTWALDAARLTEVRRCLPDLRQAATSKARLCHGAAFAGVVAHPEPPLSESRAAADHDPKSFGTTSTSRAAVVLTWDRGTILARGPDGIGEIEGMVWDPRIGAWRAPAYLLGSLTSALHLRGLELVDEVRPDEPAPIRFAPPALRAYQEAALAAWEFAGRRGTLVLPTGAGKTRTAIAAIARVGARTLCLVPTRVLLDQWVGALGAAGAAPVGRYGDGMRDLAPITVSTYASATRNVERLGNRFELLVIDEAHHFGGLAGDECLEMCTAGMRMGLTATPPEDGPRALRLERVIGPVVYRCAISDLAGRFLAPFRVSTLSLPLTATEEKGYAAEVAAWRPVVRQFFATVPEASWGDFVAAAQRSETGQRALASWRRSRALLRLTQAKREVLGRLLARHTASRVLVFAPDAVTAYAISREQLVPVITADIGRAERTRILASFAAGELRTIVSARVLNEGVDVPAADVAILVGGTQGAREYVQRIGRVLRPAADKEAVVYELVTLGTQEVAQADQRRLNLAFH